MLKELIELDKEFPSDEVFGFAVRGKLKGWQASMPEYEDLREVLKKILIELLSGADDGVTDHTIYGYIDEEIIPLMEAEKQEAIKKERERIKSLLLDLEWGTMCEDNDKACPSCKLYWQALAREAPHD